MLTSLPDYWFNLTGKTQRRTVTTTNGSVAVSYADNLTNLAARLVVGGGGETTSAARLESESPYKLYFQGAPDILTTDRFVYSNRVFDITNVNNFDEAAVYTRCDAAEVQPSGVGA